MNLDLLAEYGPRMVKGLVLSLQLVVIATLLAALLALPLALCRNSRNRLLSIPARAYIAFFRGTPLLAQLFFVYYGAAEFRLPLQSAGLWWVFKDAYPCAVLAFVLNTLAFQAEILRGALGSLPSGQREAALSLGLGHMPTLFRVLLPQALIVALRPLGNEFVLLLKATAVASIITVPDLMQATRIAYARTYEFEVYLWAAALYLIVIEAVRRLWRLGERRLTRHLHA